ncbi:hypothetical protein JHK84_031551 [Glycine max]|nr:hypothetical protein JHK84_031551 [Glycine max]
MRGREELNAYDLGLIFCQKSGGGGGGLEIIAQEVYRSMSNYTSVFKSAIKKELGYCIVDVDADWNGAFNFTKDLTFLTICAQQLKGDITQRMCTEAEIQAYGQSFASGKSGTRSSFLKPNINCNLSSWVNGCEPGWGCKANQKVDIGSHKKGIPIRSVDCQPCCEGFFCPHGLTCMIPCPLGSYCPRAQLNKTSGVCEPYRYQLPPGKPNHTCGGADIWADIQSSSEVFCSAGYYCRTGSTTQERCFKLASCEPKSSNQNITAYGVLVFAGLCFLLIIIYNCSDQVLATREKRQAKSRERAAQSVRESQAREKWKSAKDTAKKHAVGLQSQLSRTFSRKTSKNPDLKGFGSKHSDSTLPPVGTSKGKKKDKNNLSKIINDIEENPNNSEGFNVQIGDKNVKKQAPRGKQLHTQSQIFKYAYGQIEKEKALAEQNKNLTFSGVISMANDIEIRKRPTIEVAFKDLTLTLKGKNKHLLRCVTGKLHPGRVSAVMGPSGAGKTTFLSALTGKATGCHTTGQVLVNGKESSIRSYKKIIGFVPQDDIVHGNLTVEENLWFSARCRLSADLPKEEKVLVVERVIESLGLQAIRDSLVGTVEKRGISGGQRKRVNVGLEMVMEPSLLILDEPTSGLDSSSSQLLLRALRREALEGVNICSSHGAATATENNEAPSFAGELWQDVKCNVEMKKDNLHLNFLSSNDLSDRLTPGVFNQYKYFLGRVGKQRLREARTQAVDFLILLLAGLCLGTLAKVSDESFGATGYTYTVIAVFYCVTGIAYVLAIFLQPGPAQLWSVLLPVVLTLVATYSNEEDSKYIKFLSDLCYTKWALEAFVISNAKRFDL